jgi:hypothetical protein
VPAWRGPDAILALSFWGYGGVYVQQALVDGPGLGDGSASCHACQGIGVELSLSFDTGLLTWAGQERGWASLFEPTGSKKALELAAAKFPGENDFENRGKYAIQLAMQFLSQLGARYLFDAPAVWNGLPTNVDDVRDGRAWRLGGGVMLSHACTQSADDRCSSLGIASQKGQAELTRLVSRRIDHHGRRIETAAAVQAADARLIVARAVSGSATGGKNIWQRLSDLGVPVSEASRSEISTQSFDFAAVFDKPSLVVEPMVGSLPAVRQILVSSKELGLDAVAYVDEQHEITKIDPRRVGLLANWSIDGTQYWLTHENYQTGNSATPENQYLHILSGKPGGLRVVDLSTRLAVAGTLAKSTDQKQLPDHPWPSNVDMLTLVAKRYLLASGQWLHDRDRWGLVYDLQEDRTLFFDGHLPNGNATKSIAITDDGRVFMAANNNGQIYFWRIATGERILSGNYVDDELVVYDANGYFMATYEGAQFVFLKFPGLPGYLSFKQFAKTLARPDIVKALLAGNRAPTPPNLSPPPRLAFAARANSGHPGRLQVSFSVSSTRDLDTLRLFIDGQFWSERVIRGHDITIDEAIDIPPQARWLTAVAVDTSGSQSVPVARALPRDERASGRKLFVLAIGTDTYTRLPADLQLRYAVSDARNFLAAVKSLSSGYYASVEAREFLDAPDLKTRLPPTLRELARAATQDDTIMLFASGHGFRDPAGKLYLLTGESEPENIAETSLSWDDLARAFEGTRARIIVFIDACHSGAVPNGGSNDEIADALSARQVHFTVIAAAKGRQESFEKDELGGGVFTSAIVKALTGSRANLDTNHNGVIELTELYSKIKPAILSEMHGSQTPWIARADMVGEVPLF